MNPRAFTLAEILVFLGVVSVALLALISVQIFATRGSKFNRMRHTASTIVASQMNTIQHQLTVDFTSAPSYGRQPVTGYPEFTSAMSNVYADSTESLRKINLSVYWTDEAEREFSAWTYIYHAP